MPREQVMCAGVSGGSAADDGGLAGASLKCVRSLISGARCYYSKREAAPRYVGRLGSAIHGVFLYLLSIAAAATVRAIFRKCCRIAAPLGFVLLQQATGIDGCGFV
jgi:hypothetical protein